MLTGNGIYPPPLVGLPPLALAIERTTYRVSSIDLLRGVVMIIMALDHAELPVEKYFSQSR